MLDESAYRAEDLMTRDVSVVRPETPLRDAVRIMAERQVTGLPVVNDAGVLIGMITEGDLVRWREGLPEQEQHWLETLGEGYEIAPTFMEALLAERHTVKHVMKRGPVVTVTEDTPARQIASLMHAKGVKRVPVMRDDQMIGIVSRSDLVRGLARALEESEQSRRLGALPPRPGA